MKFNYKCVPRDFQQFPLVPEHSLTWEVSGLELGDYSQFIEDHKLWQPFFANSLLSQSDLRKSYLKGGGCSSFDKLIDEIDGQHSKITDLFYSEENRAAFQCKWPVEKEDFLRATKMFSVINHDGAEFSMSPHIDNRKVVAVMIINLMTNSCVTDFYSDDGKKIWYRSPAEIGTGILMLNSENSTHGINVDQPRLTVYSNIILANI